MKPIPFKVTKKENASFHIQENEMPHQYDRLHVHPEYQISLILKGQGVLSLGNSLEEFGPGDIYVIASNVPHVFKNKPEYFQQQTGATTHMVSLFFNPITFGRRVLQLPELTKIDDFLKEAARGVKIKPNLAEALKELINRLKEAEGATRLILFLDLLNKIALTKDKVFLSSIPYEAKISTTDSTMNKIYNYISKNFDQPISLEEVSKVAHLDKYAFCRYFKKVTHKSFVSYLNEFRVSMACKLLLKNTYSISQVCFLVGYNNISNFYKQFKKVMKVTPSKYIELYGECF